jgi:hypothetical protein
VYTSLVPPPLKTPPSRQNLFRPLLWFCWRENIRDNKKDITFLLIWDKESYIERFLALLPCTCVLQPKLIHLYSLLLPGPLPIVAAANLRLLYSLLNRKHINHIQILAFLFFPYFSHSWSLLSVWPMSHTNFTHLFGLLIYIWRRTWDFWSSELG